MKRPDDTASTPEPSEREAARPSVFTTTHWSLVMRARHEDPAAAGAAMGRLYEVYRLPIYNFICRQYRCNHQDAEDLTQGFFEHLIQKATVKKADRDIGKFRTFLLGALSHFRANERDRILAEKRGGKCKIVSLNETGAPEMPGKGPSVAAEADKQFNRDWALALVKRAREQLQDKYAKEGKAPLFAMMEPALLRENVTDLYAQWAAVLGMGREAVEVAFHRLRRRFGKALRHEVAQTVNDSTDADEELRHLLAAFTD